MTTSVSRVQPRVRRRHHCCRQSNVGQQARLAVCRSVRPQTPEPSRAPKCAGQDGLAEGQSSLPADAKRALPSTCHAGDNDATIDGGAAGVGLASTPSVWPAMTAQPEMTKLNSVPKALPPSPPRRRPLDNTIAEPALDRRAGRMRVALSHARWITQRNAMHTVHFEGRALSCFPPATRTPPVSVTSFLAAALVLSGTGRDLATSSDLRSLNDSVSPDLER